MGVGDGHGQGVGGVGCGIARRGQKPATMKATWVLSAPPVPTTAFFTTLAAYSLTESPAWAGASMAAARAWPSFRVDEPLAVTKVSSIAASSGPWAATTSLTATNRQSRRSESGELVVRRDHAVGDVGQPRALDR